MELQTPTGALGDNPSGIGTAILGNSYDPTESNLKALAISDDWYGKALQQQKDAKANSLKFISDLNPDVDGALDSDIPGFRAKQQELQNIAQLGVKSGFPLNDPRNPYFQTIQNKRQDLLSQVAMSKVQKQNQFEQQSKFNPDKDDANTFHQWQTAQRLAPDPVERAKLPISGIVDKIPPYDVVLESLLKNPKITGAKQSWWETSPDGLEQTQHVTTENITLPQAQELSKSIRSFPNLSKGVDDYWATITPEKQRTYQQPYLLPGNPDNPTGNPVKALELAKQDMNTDHIMAAHHAIKSEDPKVRFTAKEDLQKAGIRAYSAVAADEDKMANKGAADGMQIMRLFTGDDNEAAQAKAALMGRGKIGVYKGDRTTIGPNGATTTSPVDLDNSIVDIDLSNRLSNGIRIKTDESIAAANGDKNKEWIQYAPGSQDDFASFISGKSTDGKYANTHAWFMKNGVVSGIKGSSTAKAIAPTPAKAKPITSTIDETDKWKPENEYQIGQNVYYYDNAQKKWLKK